MSHSVIYDQEACLTVATYRGKVDLAVLREGAIETARLASGHDCFLILIDCREVALDLSTLDIYHMPEMLAKALSASGLEILRFKRALVVSGNLDDFAFVETVSRNRSQNARIFRDIEEAKKWLSEK